MMSLVFAFFVSPPAFGWGAFAHRVTAALAEKRLCPQAAAQLHQILGSETFPDASVWADQVRTDPTYRYLKPWHFVDMPFASHYDTDPHGTRGDVVTAIPIALQKLRSGEPLLGLRLLAHFVGDAHQPLHAGRHEDAGGNAVDVTWFGRADDLHHVWDTLLPIKGGASVEQLATELDANHADVAQGRPADWVDESSALAPTVYPTDPALGDDYVTKFLPLAKKRMFEAGVRLATMLNQEWCSSK